MTIQDHITELAPHEAVRDFIDDVLSSRKVFSDRRGAYVSLRPNDHTAIAVFAYAAKVSIALPPLQAPTLTAGLPQRSVLRTTPATTTIELDVDDLLRHRDKVRDLALWSLNWREDSKNTVGIEHEQRSADAARPVCPVHFMPLSPAGECEC